MKKLNILRAKQPHLAHNSLPEGAVKLYVVGIMLRCEKYKLSATSSLAARVVLSILWLLMVSKFGGNSASAAISYADLYILHPPAGVSYFDPNGLTANAGQAAGYGQGAAGLNALVWSSPTGNAVDLNPAGFTNSYADATSGIRQIGYGSGTATSNNTHALLWSGSASTAIDLNPAGMTHSYAFGINGNTEVGNGDSAATGGESNAFIWTGTAASAINLNPSGFYESAAFGNSGTQQVGFAAGPSTGANQHAMVWHGSASGAVDLNPNGFTLSRAYGCSGTQQVGYGYGTATGGAAYNHALVWNGSAASAVDLNPVGFSGSVAYSTNGSQQVGYGRTDNSTHALLWSGSASTFIDLESALPSNFNYSQAYSISGNTIYGVAADTSGNYHAVTWTITVPEPAALLPAAMWTLCLFVRKRNR